MPVDSREDKKTEIMKKISIVIALVLVGSSWALGAGKDIDIQGKRLISQRPPFSFNLPSELQWIYASSAEHPSENSRTRTAFFIRENRNRIEEMLIIQIADKTNPQAGPIVVPPLKPFNEKRMYTKGKIKKGEAEVEYLTQLMAWNPEAPSLQPIIKKGLLLSSQWVLQCQFLFQPRLEHAVFIRYAKDIHSFGIKVSDEGKNWEKESISGEEKKVYESFQKATSGMMKSLALTSP